MKRAGQMVLNGRVAGSTLAAAAATERPLSGPPSLALRCAVGRGSGEPAECSGEADAEGATQTPMLSWKAHSGCGPFRPLPGGSFSGRARVPIACALLPLLNLSNYSLLSMLSMLSMHVGTFACSTANQQCEVRCASAAGRSPTLRLLMRQRRATYPAALPRCAAGLRRSRSPRPARRLLPPPAAFGCSRHPTTARWRFGTRFNRPRPPAAEVAWTLLRAW